MKVSAVSGDLLVKVALIAAGLGAAWWVYTKARDEGTGIVQAAADAVNPANPDNIVNTAVSAAGAAIVTDPAGPGKNADGSWSAGAWLFDVFHPQTRARISALAEPGIGSVDTSGGW